MENLSVEGKVRHIISKGFITSSLLLIAALYFFPFYTQDGPNHKQVAVILSRLSSDPIESNIYQSNLGFLQTNSLFPLLYQPFAKHLSIDNYEKIFVGFFLIFLSLSYRWFLSVWNSGRFDFWFVSLLIWIHPLLFRGFYNFIAGFSLSILALTLLKKGIDEKKISTFLLYSIVSWITFLAHPFPLFILLIVLVIFSSSDVILSRRRRILASSSDLDSSVSPQNDTSLKTDFGNELLYKKLKWNLLYTLPPLFLISFKFFLSLTKAHEEGVQTALKFMPSIEQLGGLFFKNFVIFSVPTLIISLITFLWIIFLAFYSLKKTSWKSKVFWLVILFLFFYSPSEVAGGAYLNDRFLPYLLLFLPLGLFFSDTQMKKVKILFLLLFLGTLSGISEGFSKIHFVAQDYKSVLKDLPTNSRLYSINFDNQGPAMNYQPLHHFWALFDSEKTVFSPYLFAFRELNPLNKKIKNSLTYFPATYDSYPSEVARNLECRVHDAGETIDCNEIRQNGFEKIIKSAAYYDYWLIASPPKDFVDFVKTKTDLLKISETGNVSLWYHAKALKFNPPL